MAIKLGDSDKLKALKKQKSWILLGVIVVAGVSGLTLGFHSVRKGHGRSESLFSRIWHTYGHAFISIQEKVDTLAHEDQENQKLRLENAHLRLVLENQRFERFSESAQKFNQTYEWKLKQETRSSIGRTLASTGYKVPTDLLPPQLYDLGLRYFKMRQDEKAAVIFNFLTNLEGDDTYKTPSNYLLAGICWYRVQNYELADIFFDKALRGAETGDVRRVHEQARLWKGLVAQKTGNHIKSQYWLHDVMDHDPHSVEAHWINSEVRREPAAKHSRKSH